MPIKEKARAYIDELTAIRRDLHAHPELGFEETRTQGVVADTLRAYGVDEVHTDIAKTGVVGVIRGKGGSNRAIGLRADMDALPILETNDFGHKSNHQGKMHACGHDGHTTMLLGAGRYLAEHRDFDGTVYLFFQPAEEGYGGGKVMVDEGLFERFPVEQVFGMHNMPGLETGKMSMRTGPCMAAADLFTVKISGQGAHAAMPEKSIDPVVVGAHIVTALQSIVSRRADPLKAAVMSVTTFNAGDAFNVIPMEATLTGTARSFAPDIRDLLENDLNRIAKNVAVAFGAIAEVDFQRNYPATVNTAEETKLSAAVARKVFSSGSVDTDGEPKMGAEDFSFMLNERPGSYVWLGNGATGAKGGENVHTPKYDFNDDGIIYGLSYWAELVETALPREG